MAKLTTLEIVNNILRNCGERSDLTALTSLTGIQNVVWDKLYEALVEICADQDTQYQFLEADGEVPLVTGEYRYLISSLASVADMQREDRKSFRQFDSGNRITFLTPQEWDSKFPKGIESSMTGYPDNYMKFGGYIVFDKYATANENGDIVNFRYWRHPTAPSTSTPTATLDIPEPFDRVCLVTLATAKVLAYIGNDEAVNYYRQVYGDPNEKMVEGTLNQLKAIYSSPDLKPRVSFSAK